MKKLVTLASAALIGLASMAAAEATRNSISEIPPQRDNLLIHIPVVNVTADSELQIRRITGSSKGEVLGSVRLDAGSHTDLRVNLSKSPNASALLAVIVQGGEDVATEEIELRR